MIVGHGAIASVLTDRDDSLYFASGVANSSETRDDEFRREAQLLYDQDTHRHIVYFSSLCIFYQDTRYSRHKRLMESIVKEYFPCHTIMRLGNIDWATNPNQLIPFIKSKLKNREPFDIYDEYRHILDKREFLYWVDRIPDWNCEMNITGRLMKISEILERYQNSQWTL